MWLSLTNGYCVGLHIEVSEVKHGLFAVTARFCFAYFICIQVDPGVEMNVSKHLGSRKRGVVTLLTFGHPIQTE